MLRGLAGFAISATVFNSMVGTLTGIKNLTSVKVRHEAHVDEPFRLDDITHVDEHLILHLLPSDEVTGLPKYEVESLIAKIDEIIGKATRIEAKLEYPTSTRANFLSGKDQILERH
jgi:hypothetical protein